MTRRRPGASQSPVQGTAAGPVSGRAEPSIGIWYAALIGAVLLIATSIYAVFLYQQREEWRNAADQLTIGQELLRADRDEILQKTRQQDVTLATLEAAREQDQIRLEGLENQRSRLQGDVLRLTQEVARSERQINGTSSAPGRSANIDRLQQERDRLERDLKGLRNEAERLKKALANKERALDDQAEAFRRKEAAADAMRAGIASLEAEKAAVEQDAERFEWQLEERRRSERWRQIVRGHRASLGEVRPYIAAIGPEDWRLIESWLAQQLRRPMAVPDLSDRGWSYEGARLLGTVDGPPMAMLLYADAEERPASLTVARDRGGERGVETSEDGDITLLSWREERHAFFLAGEAEDDVLRAIAADLQNEPPMLNDEASVPVSRYIRPSFRPAKAP